MLFVPAVIRKLNPLSVKSKWRVISATFKHFSSSTGYSPEEIEQFRKVFRTMPSYEESIASKDLTPFLQLINFNTSAEAYQKHIEFVDKLMDGRVELSVAARHFQSCHDPRLLMNEYITTFDRNNDGYISKQEFELGMEDVKLHDPRIQNVSYEKFLKQADTNKDGKVSVSECRDWANKYLVVPA